MMKKLQTIILLLLFACIVVSCNLRDMRLRPVLAEIDTLLICNRDSEAYALFEPIRVGMFDVDNDTYALYCTLLLQAQDRCDVPLNDTLAVSAYNYYHDNRQDLYHAGLAHYYLGKVARLNNDHNTSIYILKQAQELFDSIGCNRYSFLARENEAMAHIARYSMRLALDVFRESLRFAEKIGNDTYVSSSLIWIAQCYISLNMPDSAIITLGDARISPSFSQRIGLSYAYAKKGDWTTALLYNDTCLTFALDNYGDATDVLFDRSDILANMGNYKDCCNLLDTLIPQTTIEKLAYNKSRIIAGIMQYNNIEMLKRFKYYDAYYDSLFIHENEMEVENINRMISEQNKIANSKIEVEHRLINLLTVFIIVFLIATIMVIRLQWQKDKVRNSKILLEAQKAELVRQLVEETMKSNDYEEQLKMIEAEMDDAESKDANAEDRVMRKNICNVIAQGISKLQASSSHVDKINFVIAQIEYVYPQMHTFMQKQYPFLDANDIVICCMTRTGFSASVISDVLNKSANTIRARQKSIRESISMQEKRENMNWDNIWELLEKRQRRAMYNASNC